MKNRLEKNISDTKEDIEKAKRIQGDIASLELAGMKALEELDGLDESEIVYEILDDEYYQFKKTSEITAEDLERDKTEETQIIKDSIKLDIETAKEVFSILEEDGDLEYYDSEFIDNFKEFIDNIPINRQPIELHNKDRIEVLSSIVNDCRYAGLNVNQTLKYISKNWITLKEIYHYDQLSWK